MKTRATAGECLLITVRAACPGDVSLVPRNRHDADLERCDGLQATLKCNRPEDNVDPSVEEFAFPFFVVEVGIFLAEGFDGDVFEGDVHDDELLQGGLAAHFGEPFVVELSADIVGVAVDADLVKLNIGDGVEQLQQLLGLLFVHIVAATPKEDALLDQACGRLGRRCILG